MTVHASYIRILPARQRPAGQRGAYPELFAVLGGNVPDLRGLFLRGHGGNSAALGIRQSDMVGVHDHIVSIRDGDGGGSGTPAFDETRAF